MKLLLFTAQDIGYVLADYFATRSDIDLSVVTYRRKKDEIYGYRTAVDACERHGIQYLETLQPNQKIDEISRLGKPDFIVAAYYGRILSPDIIRSARLGAINVHPGIFPRYRGTFPTPWYILNGEDRFGIAVHYIDEGVDSGPVLVQKTFEISPEETGHSLYRNTMKRAAEVLIENFDNISSGAIKELPQAGYGSYYSSVETRYKIDWNLNCETILRRIRVHAPPYFPAYSYMFNKIFLFERAVLHDDAAGSAVAGGRIVEVFDDGTFAVTCSDGCLKVESYQVAPQFAPHEEGLHLAVGNTFE